MSSLAALPRGDVPGGGAQDVQEELLSRPMRLTPGDRNEEMG
jgi:hypothetical protein